MAVPCVPIVCPYGCYGLRAQGYVPINDPRSILQAILYGAQIPWLIRWFHKTFTNVSL